MARPISISPSPANPYTTLDGQWTAFQFTVGDANSNRFKVFSVPVATSQSISYVPFTQSCTTHIRQCAQSRGGIFDPNSSPTWDYIVPNSPSESFWGIATDGPLLGDNAEAYYGYAKIAFGYGIDSYPGYGKHLLGTTINYQLYLGLMGIKPVTSSVGNPKNLATSSNIIQDLKNQSIIPSISWGYTGGAPYQLNNNGPFGSLTIGGYDPNRFHSNDVTFPMDPAEGYAQYLSLYVQSIKASTKKDANKEMLSKPIYAALDSTVSYIYLPVDACSALEDAFGLKWESKTEYYYISDDARKALLAQNPSPSVTFTLAPQTQGGKSVDITLPYRAFDLKLLPGLANLDKPQHYFPIKRASADSGYILGRTFFQEAYVIADFERSNFSVSQCYFTANPRNAPLVSIPSAEKVTITHPDQGGSSTNAGVIAGPVVAVIVILVLAVLGFWFWRRRKRRQNADLDEKGLPAYSDHVAEMDGYGIIKKPEKTNTELEAIESGRATPVPNDQSQKRAPGASPLGSPPRGPDQTSPNVQSPLSELDSSSAPNTYFELPGSMTQRQSMGPREMDATALPTEEVPTEGAMSANQPSGPLPDLPEPSPPLDTATTSSNPLTSGMDTVAPPPPPKDA